MASAVSTQSTPSKKEELEPIELVPMKKRTDSLGFLLPREHASANTQERAKIIINNLKTGGFF